jgi:fumarate hydratase subunit beta
MDRHIKAPFDREEVKTLKAGDYVYIDGIVYSARDAAHKRMYDAIMESGCVDASGTELYEKGIVPIDLNGNVIYYLGPTPAKPGQVIGSAGPTTSKGLCGMIGKGKRSQEVIQAIIDNKAVYLAAVGGAGALLSKCIKKSEVIAYDDLGTEAIRKMTVENFPAIVVIDSEGHNLYETAVKDYLEQNK